jgi:hypothetical protein
MLEIKIPREVAIFSAVFLNNYSIQNCTRRCAQEICISTSTFFEKTWLISYRGVVTVTELDFGPRTVLTTAAIA